MAQLARPHAHLSNRAKARSALERKPVFKSVLENPFRINWPFVSFNVQNVILARLVVALQNLSLRLRHSQNVPQNKTEISCHQQGNEGSAGLADALECGTSYQRRMSGDSKFVIGINAVTKALEYQLQVTRRHAVESTSQHVAPPAILVVFVCCADVDPLALVDHIPYLVAGCNSPKNVAQLVKLVPLPKGSEQTISEILGVRRAATIAIQHGSAIYEMLHDTLVPVPIITAPWLCPPDIQGGQLVPTHVKQLRTTAPKDMKAAREQRSRARAAAKTASGSSRPVRRKPRVTLAT